MAPECLHPVLPGGQLHGNRVDVPRASLALLFPSLSTSAVSTKHPVGFISTMTLDPQREVEKHT